MELAALEPAISAGGDRVCHVPPTELYIGAMANPRSF